MNVVLVILAIALHQTWAYDDECDKLGILVYEDLGCKPVKDASDKCPKKYSCPDFNQQNSSCFFKTVGYKNGDLINDDLIYPACQVHCTCESMKKFRCAALDCPEWLGHKASPNCHLKYDLNKCCSDGEVCPPFEATCEFENKTYNDGERFYPSETCKVCVCGKNFNGTLKKPFCRREVCASEINHSEEIASFCAPSYLKSTTETQTLCCPSKWVCPNGDEKIKEIDSDVNQNSDLKCRFGETEVNLGFGFEKTTKQYGKNYNLKCQCRIPPFLTCTMTQ